MNCRWIQTPSGSHYRYGRFAISLVHLNCGWRYWARERYTSKDIEHGLPTDGFATLEAAQTAVETVPQ